MYTVICLELTTLDLYKRGLVGKLSYDNSKQTFSLPKVIFNLHFLSERPPKKRISNIQIMLMTYMYQTLFLQS